MHTIRQARDIGPEPEPLRRKDVEACAVSGSMRSHLIYASLSIQKRGMFEEALDQHQHIITVYSVL